MDSNDVPHFLLATFPHQSHLNPTVQLAKHLIRAGARVTVATTIHGQRVIKSFPSYQGLAFAFFSDGFDNGASPSDIKDDAMSKIKHVGSQTLTNLLLSLSSEGHPVNFLIYNPMLSWVADVARSMSIPSAFLCIQAATLFAIYYHIFTSSQTGAYDDFQNNCLPSMLNLKGLPQFELKDLPSIFLPLPNNPYSFIKTGLQEQIQVLQKDPNPCVLINTFDALEEFAIKALVNSNIKLITIGPLVLSESRFSVDSACDIFDNSSHDNYTQWLNSKPDTSVVYISFGSFAVLPRIQMEEILDGMVDSGYSFLLVIRKDGNEEGFESLIKNRMKEEEKQGLIVPWCSQIEVLNHRAIGCFVTHCGWNSTIECLVAGVPMIAIPQFLDQATNAKLVEDVWETGVRTKVNESEVVEKEEIKRCLEIVMGKGEKGEAMRKNAQKWKALALEAMREGGSSANNFKAFMNSFSTEK